MLFFYGGMQTLEKNKQYSHNAINHVLFSFLAPVRKTGCT